MFFNVCLQSRSFPLRADWRKSDSSVDGEPQGNCSWNSNCRDVVASSWLSKLFFRAEVKMTLGLVHASYSLPYMHIFLCLFVAHSFIHYLTHSFVYSVLNSLFIPSFIRWFVCLFIHSLVRSFFHSFIRFFVRSFIHSLTNSYNRHTLSVI